MIPGWLQALLVFSGIVVVMGVIAYCYRKAYEDDETDSPDDVDW